MSAHYSKLISPENLFQVWGEFKKGKRGRRDVQVFGRHLEDNLFDLHEQLKNKTYRHGSYQAFYVHDPKQRRIHKARVEDRIVHHLLYKFLYETFDKTFIYDSYSCRLGKGTHKAVSRLEKFTRIVSKNYSRPCWALKFDIKKFFASADQKILLQLLGRKIKDEDILWLLAQVIDSFQRDSADGIPLGNLTSQIFANIYLNELDQFVKQKLRFKYYLRYCDDFLLLSESKEALLQYIDILKQFLKDQLKLELHPHKVIFRKLNWGIDFLGYIVLPHYRLPRTKTKRRIFNKATTGEISEQSLNAYLGYLSHANTFKVEQELKNLVWFRL